MLNKKSAIIIGSGVAGLASAIRLACQNYQVSVFEKNEYLGGKLSAFSNNNFHFDAGPSLFTQAAYIEELFTLANKPISNYFKYTKVAESCRYFFTDKQQLIAPANANELASLLATHFNEDEQKVLAYLNNSKNAFNNIGTLFTERSLHTIDSYKQGRLINALKHTKAAYLFKSLNSYNEQYFKHPNTIQLFNRFATYNGSNPYKAPAMLSMIPHFEINEGTYYPFGGMVQITNALVQLAKDLNVQFHTNANVQQINIEKNKATSIIANNNTYTADKIISNVDIYYTYKNLLNNAIKANYVLQQERSSSAFIFYWAINKVNPQLGLHNIFFSNDYKKEFDYLFNDAPLPQELTVYVNISAKIDDSQAPANCENWFVMINAPAHKQQDWEALKTKFK